VERTPADSQRWTIQRKALRRRGVAYGGDKRREHAEGGWFLSHLLLRLLRCVRLLLRCVSGLLLRLWHVRLLLRCVRGLLLRLRCVRGLLLRLRCVRGLLLRLWHVRLLLRCVSLLLRLRCVRGLLLRLRLRCVCLLRRRCHLLLLLLLLRRRLLPLLRYVHLLPRLRRVIKCRVHGVHGGAAQAVRAHGGGLHLCLPDRPCSAPQ
jgi:hypothetical protein